MAVAVENSHHPENQSDYKVWHLELDARGNVVSIGAMSREELVQSLFKHYKEKGRSNWKAFLKDREQSTSVELYDFISKNPNENTHFGNLPSLSEFQETLEQLQLRMEMAPIAA
jgi:histidyl-tRNA synthetase